MLRTPIMRHLILGFLIAAGCAGSATYRGSATVAYSSPDVDMVYVSPGVQVIADYDEPVFYTNGYYWRYYGDTWYRSNSWTGGWVYSSPPRALLRIDRPHAYVHYRPHGYVERRPARVIRRQVIRDHRDRRDYRNYRRR
jgi:hypothetical protein